MLSIPLFAPLIQKPIDLLWPINGLSGPVLHQFLRGTESPCDAQTIKTRFDRREHVRIGIANVEDFPDTMCLWLDLS